MAGSKEINYFSVTHVDLHQVAGSESRVFDGDDVSLVLNGSPFSSPFLHEGHIYHIPEPRLLIVTSGEADVHLDLEQHHFVQGTAVITAPDTILEIERCSEDILLSGLAVKTHLQVAENMVVQTTPRDYEQLLRMLYILWDVASAEPCRHDVVRHLVTAMVNNVQSMKNESALSLPAAIPSRPQLLFQQFKALVNQHCDRQRSIPFYAGLLHVSPHHLSAVVSRASGHSVMYWINRAAVLRAKVLLQTTDLMTYEVAHRLGFANPPAFNYFFKRETGMTPREYREKQ